MHLSMKWLSDYIDLNMTTEEFAAGMTMSGSKVEKWSELSAPLAKIAAGKVLSIVRHEDSDKLWVAQVDAGQHGTVQIVTGADNVFEGAFVPVVLDGGAVFNRKDGTVMKIKKGKLRGIESNGMMCSYEELGLNTGDLPYAAENGILILNHDPEFSSLKPGDDILEFLGLCDTQIEFEITNNRPDCLSVLGLAREAHATFDLPLHIEKSVFQGAAGEIELSVEVQNKDLCSRYMAAVVKNVKIEPSPRWMQARLRASGVRPINNYVDITNFVMLEYGHPMHAFDKKYVNGNQIIVRNAQNGEKITLLDGSEQTLSDKMLVIADAQKPIAVAGVMGGEFSGIMDDTDTVVFESACFDGVSVRRSAKKVGRRTESSARFEKGIDPVNARDALYRALQLVELLKCGDVIKNVIDVDNTDHTVKRLKHNPVKINEILGTDIHETEQVNILKKLGFSYNDGYVTPPSVRIDIDKQCDLAEEIARIYGYNKIKSTVPKLRTGAGVSPEEKFIRTVERVVLGEGCLGCMTITFISPKAYEKAGVEENKRDSIVIRNPLGEATGVMRTSMLPSMLEVLARNINNRVAAGRFYEIGRVYLPQKDKTELPQEKQVLCIGMYGEDEDFFSLKGIIEELLEKLSVENVIYKAQSSLASYHPGRCAQVFSGNKSLGVIAQVHPKVTESYKMNTRCYIAEIDLDELIEVCGETPRFKPLPKYPATTRDLSLLCSQEVSSFEIKDIIRKSGKYIEQIDFFDLYQGAQVPDGMKSISYKLILRKPDATLTDEQADKSIERILLALAEKGITLRK